MIASEIFWYASVGNHFRVPYICRSQFWWCGALAINICLRMEISGENIIATLCTPPAVLLANCKSGALLWSHRSGAQAQVFFSPKSIPRHVANSFWSLAMIFVESSHNVTERAMNILLALFFINFRQRLFVRLGPYGASSTDCCPEALQTGLDNVVCFVLRKIFNCLWNSKMFSCFPLKLLSVTSVWIESV